MSFFAQSKLPPAIPRLFPPLRPIVVVSVLFQLGLLSCTIPSLHTFANNKFEPYQLNGGLVSAIAGRDYVIIASDTRLTDGSYEIYSRSYLGSRLWMASSSSSSSSSSFSSLNDWNVAWDEDSNVKENEEEQDNDDDDGQKEEEYDEEEEDSLILYEKDGSIKVPKFESCVILPTVVSGVHSPDNKIQIGSSHNNNNESNFGSRNKDDTSYSSVVMPRNEFSNIRKNNNNNKNVLQQPHKNQSIQIPKHTMAIIPPSTTLVASAGCAADCEALKRQIRYEINALSSSFFQQSLISLSTTKRTSPTLLLPTPTTVATLLSHTLYQRRMFPFYSFCVLAGLEEEEEEEEEGGHNEEHGSKSKVRGGIVHVYDAIGSHERVAIGTAGMGREMLQPILDRLFAVTTTTTTTAATMTTTTTTTGVSSPQQRWNEHYLTKTRVEEGMNSDRKTAAFEGDRSLGQMKRMEQRKVLQTLEASPVVSTHVDCTVDEAVALLVRAYRSVSEREISVGDNVVVCVLRRRRRRRRSHCAKTKQEEKDGGNDDDYYDDVSNSRTIMEVMRFPLKKH